MLGSAVLIRMHAVPVTCEVPMNPAPAPLSPVSVAPAPAPAPVSPVSVAPPLAPAPNIAAPQRRRRLPRNVAVVASYNDEQPAAVDREIELMINRVDV